MSSKFLPVGVDESQRQLFARSLRPRLEAELQQQIVIYAQQFGDVSVYHARHIIREHADAFFQSLRGSSSPSRPHAAQNTASRAETGASRCRLYLVRPGQPLSYTTISIFLGNVQSNLRSTPAAIFQQALSSPDLLQLLQRQHGTPSTYLPLRHVAVCPIVDRIRKLGHAIRVGGAFKKMIRVTMKTLGHLFKDTSFGKQLERPIARFILGLILERECANFGPTPFFVDRARLYTVRLQCLTRYLDKISRSAQDIAEIINNLRMPTVPDTSRSGALIRQGNMSIGTYIARSASPVASPHTIAASASVTQIAEPKLATPKQTSDTLESRSDAAPNSQTSVPVASSTNVLQHTTPVFTTHIVPNTHAVSLSIQPRSITTQVTQLVGATTRNVNANGPPTIHVAFPPSDAVEDCIPEPTRCQQFGTTDSRVGLSQTMDGVENSSASNYGTNTGHDDMDGVQQTNQPTVVAPASSLGQNENQNMPDAPPLTKVAFESTTKSTGASSSITVDETNDQKMPDVLPTTRPMLSIAIGSNLAPPVTTAVVTKDQDMTDTPLPEQSTVGSGRHISEAPTITTISSVNRTERSTFTPPVAPLTFPSSAGQPSATSSFSSPTGAESTIQSRAKLRAQANSHNHWANGKAQVLLEQVFELHRALQQALSKTDGPGPRDHFRNEVLGYIDNAGSAAELAQKIDYAMRYQMLTNADFNKLARHAHDGQHARRREAQGNIAIQNTGNTPQTNKQVAPSQAADEDNAQPAAPFTPFASSQAASNVIVQPTNLAAPSQTANTSVTISAGSLRRESATSGPQSGREELTRLLIEAQRKMMNKTDRAWSFFAGMFDYSWRKPSDNEIVLDYVIKHPRFQGSDSSNRKRVNIEWTIDVIRELVADPAPSSCEILVWTCNEALNAQDVKADEEIPGSYATCADRQKELGPLFRRISATNFGLMKQVFPSGCLTWDEMKNLAKTEELSFFKDKKPGRYVPYMRNLKEYWRVEDNMKNFIVDRNEAQSMATGQETTSGLTGSPKAKRNIAGISSDHDKVSKEKDADAMNDDDDDETNVPEANDPASKRFCIALTEKEERAAMKEKMGRRADDSGGSDRMKRSRE